MSDNPFGTELGAPQQHEEQAGKGRGIFERLALLLVGLALIVAGFVWKLFSGTVEQGAEVSPMDFAWLAPVVVGGIVGVVAMRKGRSR